MTQILSPGLVKKMGRNSLGAGFLTLGKGPMDAVFQTAMMGVPLPQTGIKDLGQRLFNRHGVKGRLGVIDLLVKFFERMITVSTYFDVLSWELDAMILG